MPKIDKWNKPHNVDEQEIAKFSALASRWWDTSGEFKPLHRINPLRLDYILQHTKGIFEKKVLDVGCGGGILAESLAREGARVTGLDMDVQSLQVARRHSLESGLEIHFVCQTVESYAEDHAQDYDVVTCMEMLEHVPDPASVVRACATLVKPSGHVFFSTINRNTKAWLLAVVAAEYILKMLPKGTHDAKKFIRPSELIDWLEAASLQEKHMIGLHYNPILDRFKLGPNVDVNYMLHAQKEMD
ncbi:bifunctional 3-demethylubiquinol 3-O-methyltransferase/2-polyprenyl-6-hydroxyphenol methylase [Candidatus Williamhamiltonella defendens]|uniref:Ubiquinone biosynthesis O-methyltransferase n=1 Tax=Candidatus Williamhamiltonella defendens TaxID=138072 RepID=A0AAC9VJ52_9ENTR|nr:bifunctional 2-polyprenyl-6-hydroxyphenol methylase/3-demethylubiquinol 3-O-methyltransferase UbiG [Candidatus Hamiltonella defensa]ASV33276.1 bifunctional 3-demethylubiquinol 3-O-methyltransferase/2-polyprenyl-6-hydroxyphenol methylase [Candidatus Hamiltonella defensa]AWK16241.1 bifunctional 3-demethylubiquinol 3-O-methyltransferase/2-polyprenyl-6-hydroxyphenol methylase [Candidatus Hamiltonella defensa]